MDTNRHAWPNLGGPLGLVSGFRVGGLGFRVQGVGSGL